MIIVQTKFSTPLTLHVLQLIERDSVILRHSLIERIPITYRISDLSLIDRGFGVQV